MSEKFIKDRIIAESGECVACGLCLPHCPTYRLLQSEADSPRGRIALMNGVASERIPLNARFIKHIDRCLTCRACEAICPNKVAYGDLIDQTRALIADQAQVSREYCSSMPLDWLVRLLLRQPQRLDRLRWLFAFLQRYMQWFGKWSGLSKWRLFKLMARLPRIKFPYANPAGKQHSQATRAWQVIYPASGRVRGSVGLFLGCVARIADVDALNASIYVLNRLGYTVHVPFAQTCCGAIDQHRGAAAHADRLAQQNWQAFSTLQLDAIISVASGCGVQLLESGVAGTQTKVMDISHFLAMAEGWNDLPLAPLAQKVLVHEPCTLRNVLHAQRYPYQLIERIPGVQPVPLAGNDQCCGAAGIYFIEHPDLADQLLHSKLALIKQGEASYLVTSNIGCALHIINGLRDRDIAIEVMHPVTLLARQMGLEL